MKVRRAPEAWTGHWDLGSFRPCLETCLPGRAATVGSGPKGTFSHAFDSPRSSPVQSFEDM